ncbi:hypothetical protein FIBSPDRAFT_571451 [Athelia psychrophila]|uniref:Uncharacterized protein n=1 Tax=Athelia psychrophila TaxID=1759441 RepID=A0A166HTK4_9AGAM|nr:hypothetical protein FIBSPDRAFT_571451 [Fibularhizoctonia sp. CBS 109695]
MKLDGLHSQILRRRRVKVWVKCHACLARFLYGFHAYFHPNPVLSSHTSHSKLYRASLLRCRSALDATFSEMFYDAPVCRPGSGYVAEGIQTNR